MHYITVIGYDDKGYIYANDPNKSSAPRKQHEDKFATCLKQAFIYWPEVSDNKPEEPKKDEQPTQPAKEPEKAVVGTEIIDISKHQGTIDFDKLVGKVAFVIARASCGSDKDIRIDEYAKAMNERGIPFGVYCYSYAGTVAKAQDEAQKMVQYVSKYNPLFYVMDAEEERLTNETIRAFAKELREIGIERIGCYVAHHRYKQYGYDSLRELYNFTWIPCYGKNDGTIAGSKKPSYICDLWQYTSTGKMAGINGNVDMNVLTGQGKGLEWFLEGAEANGAQEKPAGDDPRKVKISGGNVNVRTAPNTGGDIIGVAYNGDELEYGGVTDPTSGWLSVVYNGRSAWVSNKYGRLI